MENVKRLILYIFFFALLTQNVNCRKHGHHHKHGLRKLFVFGDSYADTGNLGKLGQLTPCWSEPYGMTFPKRPFGRFSDGRIFTDFLAKFLGNKSPVPYKYRKISSTHPYGMNFAVGGTGVFDLGNLQRNLSAQINNFQEQISEGVFSNQDVENSIAYVSIAGNDYTYYMEDHGALELFAFTSNVTAQLAVDLKRLSEVGVRKIVVANLSPVHCTPDLTRTSTNYTKCDDMYAMGPTQHNERLDEAVEDLNAKSNGTEFVVLDIYSAFMSVINPAKGARRFKQILKPCCEGKTSDDNCGAFGENEAKMYSVCRDPKNYFYFDSVHPTQAGWRTVFRATLPWLRKNL